MSDVPGLTFSAWRGGAVLTLFDILTELGRLVEDVRWRLAHLECSGRDAGALHRLSDEGIQVRTQELLALTRGGVQVVDGEIRGSRGRKENWITIRAVDSTSWDIESNDRRVLEAIRRWASDASPMPK